MPELHRRNFLKLAGASAGAAAAAGCSDHVEKLIPYVVQPEEITPGNPVIYASTCTECSVGCGLHVTTREGRPIKLEGNPQHPINAGRLCAKAQASIERSYSPDRFQSPMQRDPASGALRPIGWDEALSQVAEALGRNPARAHLLGGDPGDSASRLLDRFAEATGLGGRTIYQPFSSEVLLAASERVFGVRSEPLFNIEEADLVLDFGAELLDTGPSPVEHQRQWAAARDIAAKPGGGARLVYAGARLSLTASSSDQWLPIRPGSEGVLALALARVAIESGAGGALGRGLLNGPLAAAGVSAAAKSCGIPSADITRLGRALARAGAAVALPPGAAVTSRRAIDANAAVLLLNQVIGAIGSRVRIPVPEPTARSRASFQSLLELVQSMQEGRVDLLLVHDSNPAYSLPKALGFESALSRVGMVVCFASAANETTALADLVLPTPAPLEAWGDARPRPGLRGLVQPTLRPLHDTRHLCDSLLGIGRALGQQVQAQLPGGDFLAWLKRQWSGADWRAALQRGGIYESPRPAALRFDGSNIAAIEPDLTGSGNLTLLAFPHSLLGDGSGAALPLLQEIPDPVTAVAWESWAEISLNTAERLGVELGDVLRVTTSAGSVELAAFPRGGIRDDVIAIPTGQGHSQGHFASKAGQGLAGTPRGVNVVDLLPPLVDHGSGGFAWLIENAEVERTGRHRRLPLAQWSDNKRGRQLGEAMTLGALADAKSGANAHNGHNGHGGHGAKSGGHGEHNGHGVHEIREPFNPADDAADAQYRDTFHKRGEAVAKESPYRWGMTVDLDRCTGCSACIAACYVENNIPRVGEEESRLVRQMAWLRIDRWVGEGESTLEAGRVHPARSRERLGHVDVRNSPMMCQHCGAAPCEPVCPVIATYHNEEGLNAMIYNRCIGTRYCANNCPYKVRRFNYFDHQLTKWPEPMELALNPDVTVRGQGVMEKCTFCVQRIQSARQNAAARGEPIADGEVQTACQQTCPANAIHFGNLRDENSEVSQQADSPRGYHALHVLNTRPAVTYLAKVQRGAVES